MGNKVKKKIKCPKCKGKKVILKEWAITHDQYYIDNDEFLYCIEYELLGGFDVTHVTAECWKCKYEWKLRGVIQITDVWKGKI